MANQVQMSTRNVLVAARKLIKDPKHWCQDIYAKSADGEMVSYESERACAFCLDGALSRVTADCENDAYSPAFGLLNTVSGDQTFVSFNDAHSHAEVLELLDKAIALASQADQDPK